MKTLRARTSLHQLLLVALLAMALVACAGELDELEPRGAPPAVVCRAAAVGASCCENHAGPDLSFCAAGEVPCTVQTEGNGYLRCASQVIDYSCYCTL